MSNAILSCCGADAREHYKHSWERYHQKGVNWYCANCDADFPDILRPHLKRRLETERDIIDRQQAQIQFLEGLFGLALSMGIDQAVTYVHNITGVLTDDRDIK